MKGDSVPNTSSKPAGLLLFDEPATSQAEKAYRGLLEEIVSLRLAPGEVLVEEALCELLSWVARPSARRCNAWRPSGSWSSSRAAA